MSFISRLFAHSNKDPVSLTGAAQTANPLVQQSMPQKVVTNVAQTALKQQPKDVSPLKRTIAEVSATGMEDRSVQAAKMRKEVSGTQPLQEGLDVAVLQQGGIQEQISKVQSAVGIVPPPAENKTTPTVVASEQVTQAQQIERIKQQQAKVEHIKGELIARLIICNNKVIGSLSKYHYFISFNSLFREEQSLEKEIAEATKDNLAALLHKVKEALSSWGCYIINERAKTSLVDARDWIDECLRSIESFS